MYYKTETIDSKFHMYRGDCPNCYWGEYEPDIDTRNYYEFAGKLNNGKYAVIEINENEI